MSTALVWFRQDLRCLDNPALTLACQNHQKVILIYIKEPKPDLAMGRAQQWWLHHSLLSLKNDLNKVGLDLYFRQAEPLALLKELVVQHQVDAVYWNRCYEPMHRSRDRLIKSELKAMNVKVTSCNGSLLHEPWEVLNGNGTFFKVFTPYWRQCLRQMQARPPMQITKWPLNHPINTESLDKWSLLPQHPNWAKAFPCHWQPGEQSALTKLEHFIGELLQQYKDLRDEPAISGTSRLSPHLHFGEISPHQIWRALQQTMQNPKSNLLSIEAYLSELGWREFSYYLLYHHPQLSNTHFKSQFASFPWQEDEVSLRLWQKGLTGYPIVDAGMQELWCTGYMHNRVRMITASFLTKDLMIDWRKGAAWFWDTLLDADLANNSMGWQWVAGCGVDAAPYYRIFNPVLQGQKFDPRGTYVKKWIPALAAVPEQWIHQPWQAPKDSLQLIMGVDYPFPIVDHATARQVALSNYQRLKEEKKDL